MNVRSCYCSPHNHCRISIPQPLLSFTGKPYNNKADVWALGCVLYELMAGHLCFQGNNMKVLWVRVGVLGTGAEPFELPLNARPSPESTGAPAAGVPGGANRPLPWHRQPPTVSTP